MRDVSSSIGKLAIAGLLLVWLASAFIFVYGLTYWIQDHNNSLQEHVYHHEVSGYAWFGHARGDIRIVRVMKLEIFFATMRATYNRIEFLNPSQ